jgi:hypothetical protein
LPLFLGYVAENSSFYASLRAGPTPQDKELVISDDFFTNNGTEWRFVYFFKKVWNIR